MVVDHRIIFFPGASSIVSFLKAPEGIEWKSSVNPSAEPQGCAVGSRHPPTQNRILVTLAAGALRGPGSRLGCSQNSGHTGVHTPAHTLACTPWKCKSL